MIPPRTKDTDIATEIAQGKRVKDKIMSLTETVTERFMTGEDLNEAIASVAKSDPSINRLMLQRLVEESNTIAYNKRYDQVKPQKDRRIHFELAELGKVLEHMGDQAPAEMINPNLAKGPKGDGEMQKSAKYELAPVHRPHKAVRERFETQLEKTASYDKIKQNQQLEARKKYIDSSLFKIANCLVQSEKLYKNANYVFNTMVDHLEWPEQLCDQLAKKASDVAEFAVKTRRARPNFALHLQVDSHVKEAKFFLGEHSLLKTASEEHVKQIKVAPTSDVSTYQQLIELAKKVKAEQANVEVNPYA